jgi:hypothetical protein
LSRRDSTPFSGSYFDTRSALNGRLSNGEINILSVHFEKLCTRASALISGAYMWVRLRVPANWLDKQFLFPCGGEKRNEEEEKKWVCAFY